MALVRGRDPYVGVQLAPETSAVWGDTGNAGSWVTVPILSESLNIERRTLTETEEITPLGARESYDTGSVIAVGDITIRPRWDSTWLGVLFASMGYETLINSTWADASTASAGCYTHFFALNQTLPYAFKLRVWKSGQSANYLRATFHGCYVSTFTLNQPQDNHCTITFSILAKSMVLDNASGTIGDPEGTAISTVRDVGGVFETWFGAIRLRDGQDAWTAATAADHGFADIRSFSMTFNRGMEFEDAPINNIDQVSIPGNINQRSVEVTIEGAYNQTASTDDEHPFNNYINNVESGVAFIYCNNNEIGTTNEPYAAMFCVPRLVWTEAAIPIESGGTLVWTATGIGLKRISSTSLPDVQVGPTKYTKLNDGFVSLSTDASAKFLGAAVSTDEP